MTDKYNTIFCIREGCGGYKRIIVVNYGKEKLLLCLPLTVSSLYFPLSVVFEITVQDSHY